MITINVIFAALLTDQEPPQRGADHLEDDPVGAYQQSGAALQAALGTLELVQISAL